MEFNSLAFAFFLPIVFILYWIVAGKNTRLQNIIILIASYVFYGWWDWRFLGLIFFTTTLTYLCALPSSHRKAWAGLNICANIAVLAFFKYFNFFSESLQQLVGMFGFSLDWVTLDILLPVGISFYTFQAISYSVDVYRQKIDATRDFVAFAGFVSFFPQLVAGPIERATSLLPQFSTPRRFNYGQGVEGLRRILWGLFKKCVVADGLGVFVDFTFKYIHLYDTTPSTYIVAGFAALMFMIQIYGDFSGYSDIAKGTAQLFGFKLMDNFLFPFFSRNAIEYWRRWHRSLMQWFTEYVYFPLGGSRHNATLNILLVFALSGLWHGARWTYVAWGVMCGLWYLISKLCGAKKYKVTDECATSRDFVAMLTTFFTTSAIIIMFRATTISEAFQYYALAIPGLIAIYAICVVAAKLAQLVKLNYAMLCQIIIFGAVVLAVERPQLFLGQFFHRASYIGLTIMLLVEWRARRHDFGLACVPKNRIVRYICYTLLFYLTAMFAVCNDSPFIYFQF